MSNITVEGIVWDVAKNQIFDPDDYVVGTGGRNWSVNLLEHRTWWPPGTHPTHKWNRFWCVPDAQGRYSFNIDTTQHTDYIQLLIRYAPQTTLLGRVGLWVSEEKYPPESQTRDIMVESNLLVGNQEVLSFDYVPKPYMGSEYFNVTTKLLMRLVDIVPANFEHNTEKVNTRMWFPKELLPRDKNASIYRHTTIAGRSATIDSYYGIDFVSPEMEGIICMHYMRAFECPLLDSPDNNYALEWTGKPRYMDRTVSLLPDGTYPLYCQVSREEYMQDADGKWVPVRERRPGSVETFNRVWYTVPMYLGDLTIGPLEQGVQFSYSNVQCAGVET